MNNERTLIIAEIGINHNGSLETAKKLIDVAKVAGCDYVKFQKRNPDICVPEHQKNKSRETPWGTMKYIEYKKKVEFGKEEFDEIDSYCKAAGIKWTTSVWDLDSLDFSLQYNLDCIKIPSALITNSELLKATAQRYDEIILSSGMSTEQEIDNAVKIAVEHSKRVILMHCNSAYPAPLNELNLSCIHTLRNKYADQGVIIGYSGHESPLYTTLAAVSMGAEYIERHITLDREMWGTDQFCSLEPVGLFRLVQATRQLEVAFGDGLVGPTPAEMPARKKLRGV